MLFFLIKCQLKIEGTNRKYTYPSLKVSPHKLLRNNQKKKKKLIHSGETRESLPEVIKVPLPRNKAPQCQAAPKKNQHHFCGLLPPK